jgi:hypothetical protein
MKNSTRKVSKKNMPKDLKRVTNKEGKRVWVTGGKEYASLAEINDALKIQAG